MKKNFTLILLTIFALDFLPAQNLPKINPLAPETVQPASRFEHHAGNTLRQGPPAVQYGSDIIIHNAPTIDQRRVRMSVAFNGWLYAAYSTVDSVNGDGGITIRMSRNDGVTWTTIDSYSVNGVLYPTFDIVVAGTDTLNLTLYNVGVNQNVSSNSYVLFVDRYNATTGAFIGSNYNISNGTRPIYDVSLATDYRFPASVASPYSVGLLYSTYSSSYDSIVFLGSTNGGTTWNVREPVAITGNYFRNISLAYGRSLTASNGRYFAAWEQVSPSSARNGHIYTSHSTTDVSGSWNAPVNLDSVSPSMINLCRHPQIAVQFNNTDNDSNSCTAVVMVERDYTGNGDDYDVLGFYNKDAPYSDNWTRLDIANTGSVELQPDVTYDPANDNFLAVYYDSTAGKLPYYFTGYNLTTPNAWTNVTPQYNDVTTNLSAAYPRVEINPVNNQAAHAWIAEGPGSMGVAMFDAQYIPLSVNNLQADNSLITLYPNPASSDFTINYSQSSIAPVAIRVYTSTGEVVEERNTTNYAHGLINEKFDVSGWANGIYLITVDDNGKHSTGRVVVSH